MPRKRDIEYRTYYEVQRKANCYPDGSGGEWISWEEFPYKKPVVDDGSERRRIRSAALTAAKDCKQKIETPVRVVYVQEVWKTEEPHA